METYSTGIYGAAIHIFSLVIVIEVLALAKLALRLFKLSRNRKRLVQCSASAEQMRVVLEERSVKRRGFWYALLWMVLLILLLGQLTIIGPFVTGLIGGKKSDRAFPAICSAILVMASIGILQYSVLARVMNIPNFKEYIASQFPIYEISGMQFLVLIALPLLLGVIVGYVFRDSDRLCIFGW
ncbi:hypothetical protein ACFL1X_07375 [Candidatus Hydrogenedentota bacterium]